MAGEKQTIEVDLNSDHITLIGELRNAYNIASESKVLRIVMDYLQENTDAHDAVFKPIRCLRCAGLRAKRIYG